MPIPIHGTDPSGIFGLFFVVVLALIAFSIFSNVAEWSKNQASDVRMRNVRVVVKRTDVRRTGGTHTHHHNTGSGVHHSPVMHSGHTFTTYYITFEFLDDGERMEFKVPDKQYGLIAEGDLGIINYQGTQFNAFERTKKTSSY